MPVADEKLHEKLPFDVYAMLLILSFLATAGAVAFLNDELQTNWYAGEAAMTDEDGNVIPAREHAVHLTEINSAYEKLLDPDLAEEVKPNDEIEVTETDLKEYQLLPHMEEGAEPPEYKPYPKWLDPEKTPINTEPGFDNTATVPPEELQKLVESYVDESTKPAAEEGGGAAKDEGGGAAPAQ